GPERIEAHIDGRGIGVAWLLGQEGVRVVRVVLADPGAVVASASAWTIGFPISRVIVRAYSVLRARSTRAASRIRSARAAKGTVRQSRNTACADARTLSSSWVDVSSNRSKTLPDTGL